MSTPGEASAAEMLPGLRAVVEDARAKAAATRARKAASWEPAEHDPVAHVLLDLPLAHLDQTFDYAVPEAFSDQAVPGARVRVRFGAQEVAGFVVGRSSHSEHAGGLQPLRRAVSAERVLTPEIAELCAEVAADYAGVRADVLRLAVPPRHATTERQPSRPAPPVPAPTEPRRWGRVGQQQAFFHHLAAGAAPRAVWGAAPGDDWAAMIAEAAQVAYAAGRGVVICVPDGRDVERVAGALVEHLGEGHHAVLRSDVGPAKRYAEFLAIARGARRVVVGTRSAAFAPVQDVGLVVIWDDGDSSHCEPRAPYPHTRQVLRSRAQRSGAAMLVGGFSRSVEADQWVSSGWAAVLEVPRAELRRRVRTTVTPPEDRAIATRTPLAVSEAVQASLRSGQPVLVQTPRAGYVPALACAACRLPARCRACAGPMQLTGPTQPPVCRWCALAAPGWTCPECGHQGLRAPVRGNARTAEELGRMFPGVTVRTSHGERMIDTVADEAMIVVATVGAEPVAAHGYGTVALLDTWITLSRDDMRAEEEAVRRWLGAAGLVRVGGMVVAVGDSGAPALQALVRWDPAGFAARQGAQRASAHLPPAARVATLTGSGGALSDALTVLQLPDHVDVLGPVPCGEDQRVILRVPAHLGGQLVSSLRQLQQVRSARKLDPVRVHVDPVTV